MGRPCSFLCIALRCLAGSAIGSTAARAVSVSEQVDAIYQPLRGERAVLAPDGRQVALVIRDNSGLQVLVRDADGFGIVAQKLLDDRADVRIAFLDWTDAGHLLVATDASDVVLIDTRSGRAIPLASARSEAHDKHEKAAVVQVAGFARDGRSVTLAIEHFFEYADVRLDAVRIDLRTGERKVLLSREVPPPGGRLLADREGEPRLLLLQGEMPQRYECLTTAGSTGKWVPLDRIARSPPTTNFDLSPATYLGERSFPLGFAADPDLLYYATNVGRDTVAIAALHLQSGKNELVFEQNGYDLAALSSAMRGDELVLDRHRGTLAGLRDDGVAGGTHWFDTEIATVQARLEHLFPERRVTVLGWDQNRKRFLALIAAERDPGRYFIFDSGDGRCVELLRRAHLDPASNPTESISIETSQGGRLRGYLTRPRVSIQSNPPLIVWFHDGPWQQVGSDFQPDAQALAAMGFAVLQLNYRGSTGFGRRHAMAIRKAFDRIPVEDAVAAVEALGRRQLFDRGRVAVGGEGFGGYLALRAVELRPDIFRCAVAIAAPVDLSQYTTRLHGDRPLTLEQRLTSGRFEADFVRWYFARAAGKSTAADAHPDGCTRPVFLLQDPKDVVFEAERGRRFTAALTRRGLAAGFMELPPLFARGLSIARAPVFKRIGAFLQTNLVEPAPNPGERSVRR